MPWHADAWQVCGLSGHDAEAPKARPCIIGRSQIVGKPLASLLLQRHATVTICHSQTRDLPSVARQADILIAAIGRPALIGRDYIKPGAAVIDVGVNKISDASKAHDLSGSDDLAQSVYARFEAVDGSDATAPGTQQERCA